MESIENSKQYSLRWEKHAFNLASEAGYFFEDESFLDCTLSAEGQCIDAHKIILSASSSYLSSLLKIMPDKHPILIFNDIKFEQLKSLVAFIYNGSVNVSENNIHAFLNAAQSLLIKGLSEETKEDDRNIENIKKHTNAIDIGANNHKKLNLKAPALRKPEIFLNSNKNFKRQRQTLTKPEGEAYAKCEESLSKLQEISFTKYIHQNLNTKLQIRNEILENKWNGLTEDKSKNPGENYIVKSWKHNSMDDLNGKHKPSKNNFLKKIKLEKPLTNLLNNGEETDHVDKSKASNGEEPIHPTGNNTSRSSKSDEIEENIKKEGESEQILLVEPKREIPEEEEANLEEFNNTHSVSNEIISSESDSIYEGRSVANFYQQPVVERGVPVPLLMCRTSLCEPETVEPDWMSQISSNISPDHSSQMNSSENVIQDLQCRTCAQDLPCPTCTKKYKSRYALNRHILYECGKARKSFSCDECGKKVTRQDTLQKHKLIHLVQHLKKKESETDEESPKCKKTC